MMTLMLTVSMHERSECDAPILDYIAVIHIHAGSLTALRCLGYFLGAKQKKKGSSSTGNPFIDVPGLLIEPLVSELIYSIHFT